MAPRSFRPEETAECPFRRPARRLLHRQREKDAMVKIRRDEIPNLPPVFARAIRCETRRLVDLLEKTRHSPNPKHVHRLRVCIRRLRTYLWILRGKSERSRLEKELRSLAHRLGDLRDVDVVREILVPTDGLRSLRRERREKVLKKLKRKKVQRLRRLASDLSLPAGRPTGLRRLERKLQAWSRRPDYSPRGVHELRIDVKKARYALEALGGPTTSLARLQDALGKAHDLDLVASLGERPPSPASRRDALRAVKRIAGPTLAKSRVRPRQAAS